MAGREMEVVEEKSYLTGKQMKAQVNAIQDVMKSVMKDGTHYGTIPGCGDKKALLKPGAEKIMLTFQMSNENVVEDLSTDDEKRYRVSVKLYFPSGRASGSGVGECSSEEEKYKWRAAIGDQEYNETAEDRRRLKWKKGFAPKYIPYQAKQVRMNPADIANTVLKMAKKRALVDAVLTGTAASDIFVQDLEEMPQEIAESLIADESIRPESTKPEVKQPEKTEAASIDDQQNEDPENQAGEQVDKTLITEKQSKRLYAIASSAGYDHDYVIRFVKKNFEIDSTLKLKKDDYETVCTWFEKHPKAK
jgi:hypothetical protein